MREMEEMKLHSSVGETYTAAITDVAEKLGEGKEGAVQKITVAAEHERGIEIGTLAEKTFHTRGEDSDQKTKEKIARTLELHKTLLEKNYPTIPKMLTNEKGDTLYMTDMTKNGEQEVYSTPDFERTKPEQPVALKNAEALSMLLGTLLSKSAEDRLFIEKKDVFFLPIDKETREGQIIFGDLNKLQFVEEGKSPVIKKEEHPEIDITEYNAEILRKLVRNLNPILDKESQLSTEYIEQALQKIKGTS